MVIMMLLNTLSLRSFFGSLVDQFDDPITTKWLLADLTCFGRDALDVPRHFLSNSFLLFLFPLTPSDPVPLTCLFRAFSFNFFL